MNSCRRIAIPLQSAPMSQTSPRPAHRLTVSKNNKFALDGLDVTWLIILWCLYCWVLHPAAPDHGSYPVVRDDGPTAQGPHIQTPLTPFAPIGVVFDHCRSASKGLTAWLFLKHDFRTSCPLCWEGSFRISSQGGRSTPLDVVHCFGCVIRVIRAPSSKAFMRWGLRIPGAVTIDA